MEQSIEDIKINIGCGGNPIDGFINIDIDDIETVKCRYPQREFLKDMKIYNYDIFNLPFDDESVSKVRADALIEHLSFVEEPKFFYEVKRVLKRGGIFQFMTTNFEKIVKLWLAAEDDWKEFYRTDDDAIAQQHWFGQYSYSAKKRWGYLSAMIFGSQNGEGQYHRNCYTIPKIRAILKHLNFEELELTEYLHKGDRDPLINVIAMKPKQ